MKKTYTFFLFLIFLTGCIPGRQDGLRVPEDMAPPSWTAKIEFQKVNPEGNGTFWIDSFETPPLTKAVRVAWLKNPDILGMTERVIATGEGVVASGADIYPLVNADISGTRRKRNLIGFNFPGGDSTFTSKSFNSGINVSWELDLWGKRRDFRKSSKKKFDATRTELDAARLSIAGQVAKAWFEMIENEGQLRIARNTTATYSQAQAFIEDRFEKGLASALDNDLATSSLSTAKANLSLRKRMLSTTVRKVEFLQGMYPDGILDQNVTVELPRLNLPPEPPSPSQALEQRPDLKASLLQVEASGLDLRVSQKNLLPSLAIAGGPGSRSGEFNELLDQRFRVWEVSGAISQPIFQGGRLKAQVRKSKALQQAAIKDFKSTALRAFAEVENALSAERFMETEEQELQKATGASESAARLTWERYQRGVEGIFNTLDAQRRSFEAESRLLSLRKERLFNRIDLYLALGMKALSPQP
jgi:multidrug efflux system outer membrane protein